MSELKNLKKKFQLDEYKIYESEYWVWSLRPLQGTLGASILSLKRECEVFSECTREEFADLDSIIKIIEKTLKSAFDYDIMNYLMLMMVDKHVHYHVFPRYEKSLEINGYSYTDQKWPEPPELAGESLSQEQMIQIFDKIKQNLTN